MKNIRSALAEREEKAAEGEKWNQRILAERMGREEIYLSKLLTGKKVFRIEDVEDIARALQMEAWELLLPPGTKRPSKDDVGAGIESLEAQIQVLKKIHENTWKKK